jgi:hypothetical protein
MFSTAIAESGIRLFKCDILRGTDGLLNPVRGRRFGGYLGNLGDRGDPEDFGDMGEGDLGDKNDFEDRGNLGGIGNLPLRIINIFPMKIILKPNVHYTSL